MPAPRMLPKGWAFFIAPLLAPLLPPAFGCQIIRSQGRADSYMRVLRGTGWSTRKGSTGCRDLLANSSSVYSQWAALCESREVSGLRWSVHVISKQSGDGERGSARGRRGGN